MQNVSRHTWNSIDNDKKHGTVGWHTWILAYKNKIDMENNGLSFSAKIQVCLLTFPMYFHHHLLKSRRAYIDFPCLWSLSAENQVCLPTFPISFTINCWDPGVPINISHVFLSFSIEILVCLYQHFKVCQSKFPSVHPQPVPKPWCQIFEGYIKKLDSELLKFFVSNRIFYCV